MPTEVVAGLVTLLVAYATALGSLGPTAPRPERVEPWRVLSFVGGLLTLFLALTGPLGDLAGIFLFSAHMVQHLILTLAVPPLLLFGTPGWMLRPLLHSRAVRRVAYSLTRAPIALAVFSLVLGAWHLPLLYNLSLAYPSAHALMHVTFVLSAALGWWPIMSPLAELPRPALPLQLLYVMALGMPMVVVAALVTLAPEMLYPHYAAAPRLWGLDPLQDQRVGGIIMWVPAHVVFVIPFTLIFFRWARAESDEGDEPAPGAH